jgi:hypothetical protein
MKQHRCPFNRSLAGVEGRSNDYGFYSNQSTKQQDAEINYRFIACRLNKFQHVSDILMPIIRSSSTAAAVSGLAQERGGSSAVGRGRATTTFL